MIAEAQDFLDESMALHQLVSPLSEADFQQPTQFKEWTVNHVMQHLHFFNIVADLSLSDGAAAMRLYDRLRGLRDAGTPNVEATDQLLEGLRGQALLAAWRDFAVKLAARYGAADPKQRVKWAGPDMSARSLISARLMETWAHGQEIYDLLGVQRKNTDRIKSIAVMGVNTYGWTFHNRGETPPQPKPYLCLTAPSGAQWSWNEPSASERIEGTAEDFCQVVTQVRNVADTGLVVTGPAATAWMAVAQCFAGPVRTPPAPGTRRPANPDCPQQGARNDSAAPL